MAISPSKKVLEGIDAEVATLEAEIDKTIALHPNLNVIEVELSRCPRVTTEDILRDRYRAAGWHSFEIRETSGEGMGRIAWVTVYHAILKV